MLREVSATWLEINFKDLVLLLIEFITEKIEMNCFCIQIGEMSDLNTNPNIKETKLPQTSRTFCWRNRNTLKRISSH